jgi:hypothetical protein
VPKRTNERQQIIEMLKTMLAAPSCTVTASKFLRDVVTGADREVDVVAEYHLDGDTFVQSFEVTSKSRPADLIWVEQLLRKHENLPTDHLYLVSWSGFTATARKLAESNPRLYLVMPQVVPGPSGSEIKTLYTDIVHLTPQKTVFIVERPSGGNVNVAVFPDNVMYFEDGTYGGTALEAFDAVLKDPRSIELVLRQVHEHPKREELRSFDLRADVTIATRYLRQETPTEELQLITAIEISGHLVFEQQPLDMEVRTFVGQRFAHAQATVAGVDGLFVAVLDEGSEVTDFDTTIPGLNRPTERA